MGSNEIITTYYLPGQLGDATVRPASKSLYPRAGSDGRTNPLRHRRLRTDSLHVFNGPRGTQCLNPDCTGHRDGGLYHM